MFTRKPPELKPYLPASCGEPAFYGDYRPTAGRAENIEPGLNEAALSRLMGLDSRGETTSGFGDFEFCSGGDALMNEGKFGEWGKGGRDYANQSKGKFGYI
jgi:hypothetical protein